MAYKSLMKDNEIIQGDSSDINMFSTDMADDLSIGGWSASYTIAETLGAVPIVARALPLNDGTDGAVENSSFVFQILPGESAMLTIGTKYWVTVQITNTNIDYNSEIVQFKMKVKAQGVL